MMDNYRTKRRREDNADIIDFWLEPDLGDMSQYELKQVQFAYEKDGMRLIDGGVLERVPVSQVKALGADIVVGVDVLGRRDASRETPNVLEILIETVDIMDNYRTARRRSDFKDIIDFWLEPDLGSMSMYDLRQIQFA